MSQSVIPSFTGGSVVYARHTFDKTLGPLNFADSH